MPIFDGKLLDTKYAVDDEVCLGVARYNVNFW